MYRYFFLIVLVIITSCKDQQVNDTGRRPTEQGYQNREQNRKRHRGKRAADTEAARVIYSNDTVCVPEESPVRSRLNFFTVHPENIQVWFTTTGVVKPLSGHLAHVTTPFDGRVLKCFVKLGEKVSAGTPLFEVSSSDYLETVRTCVQARQEKELAEKNFQRKQELLESGVISKRDY
ncbi:MAG TPA: efflux RND transporter periplasmic adaptor subunit, partial [Bacteroidales bacterium]|nr:efflux RND transporter periplasmic adaptor subunit [Bacteroidales bacterium]